MVENVLLFEAFDIRWTLARTLAAAAGAFLLFAFGVLLPYILVSHGRKRAMTSDELAYMGRHDPDEVRMNYVGARGARVEARASIDTLRRLAKRGDWALFCAWPSMMTAGGMSFVCGCLAEAVSEPKAFWLFTGIAAFIALVFVGIGGLFMPWAALYTNIDLGVDGPDPDSRLSAGPTQPAGERAAPQERRSGRRDSRV
jgi:hypothetical protein